MKKTIVCLVSLGASALMSQAAMLQLINVQEGPGDWLWAFNNGTPMDKSGLVSMGYFTTTVVDSDLATIDGLFAKLGSFTSVTSAVPGTSADFAGPGYLAEQAVSIGSVTTGNALLGQYLYVIATNASTLSATVKASEYSVFKVGPIRDDIPFEGSYNGDPKGTVPILGTISTWNGSTDLGTGQYTTLKMVPEASTALLGALGALGLLRRRR